MTHRAPKLIGGGLAFLIDVLLATQTTSHVPVSVALGASVAAFLFRVATLLKGQAGAVPSDNRI